MGTDIYAALYRPVLFPDGLCVFICRNKLIHFIDLKYIRVQVGMFKIHPKVPECMSDEAKGFIMNCFDPNPDNRATATELLKDAFLRLSPRKKAKPQQECEPSDGLQSKTISD